ncbi:hypothetical protein NPIL_629401 [Nephila pilipes]|uniref:Uncharacterized protein n=1 Tax=Nephila pilipes TaxID=299642 RepID=A0A8X6TQH4_NEPPI|nr:hypothetical protein NPIL_629401 [Nephila pilipes]
MESDFFTYFPAETAEYVQKTSMDKFGLHQDQWSLGELEQDNDDYFVLWDYYPVFTERGACEKIYYHGEVVGSMWFNNSNNYWVIDFVVL